MRIVRDAMTASDAGELLCVFLAPSSSLQVAALMPWCVMRRSQLEGGEETVTRSGYLWISCAPSVCRGYLGHSAVRNSVQCPWICGQFLSCG